MTSTGLNTTLTGMAGAASSALAISLRIRGDLLERLGAVEVLAAGDEPDFKLLQRHCRDAGWRFNRFDNINPP